MNLIIEPILFLWNIIFTFYYTSVRPQCKLLHSSAITVKNDIRDISAIKVRKCVFAADLSLEKKSRELTDWACVCVALFSLGEDDNRTRLGGTRHGPHRCGPCVLRTYWWEILTTAWTELAPWINMRTPTVAVANTKATYSCPPLASCPTRGIGIS